jgi:hypothetical protein
MKKILLTSIAALFLATGTANATNQHEFQCGNVTVRYEVGKRFEGEEVRYVYHLSFIEMPSPDVWHTFRFKRGKDNLDAPYLSGKRCKVIQ